MSGGLEDANRCDCCGEMGCKCLSYTWAQQQQTRQLAELRTERDALKAEVERLHADACGVHCGDGEIECMVCAVHDLCHLCVEEQLQAERDTARAELKSLRLSYATEERCHYAATDRVVALEAALRKYGRHAMVSFKWAGGEVPKRCPADPSPRGYLRGEEHPEIGPCTCGLDAALGAKP